MAYQTVKKEYCTLIINENGPVLGVCNVPILEVDGQAFKDYGDTKELLPYEDWRLDANTRAKDLAARLSIEEIIGLMIFSPNQMVPFVPEKGKEMVQPLYRATYNGVAFEESEKEEWELSDDQKRYIIKEHMRALLLLKAPNAETIARWSNELQQLAEAAPWGIPVCIGSNPRHSADLQEEYTSSNKGVVSTWPSALGMSATFSPNLVENFGKIMAKEYRALGITVALSPQIDLATDPRWMSYSKTFGGHTKLVVDMGKAYCDGLQTTEGVPDGWGKDSVAAIAKHWPGDGTGEGGRDAHYPFGKYAVYPGENLEEHLRPFTEGVFDLNGPTGKAAGVMSAYSIPWKQDKKRDSELGNAYNTYIVHELLRKEQGYEGIVCTDWGITEDADKNMDSFGSRCYGMEDQTEEERYLQLLLNGVDQFGGTDEIESILQAYELGCNKYGKKTMRKRMEESAVRLLQVRFQLGLFENPYVDPKESALVAGNTEYRQAGYEAQLKSLVLLKNKEKCLPFHGKIKVYIPDRTIKARKNFFRLEEGEHSMQPVQAELVNRYFELVDIPEKADAAIVFLDSPDSNPYSAADRRTGGNGYFPISLQYRPYTANVARKVSIAGGDFREGFWSRSYHGKTVSASNVQDLYNVLILRKRMAHKPIIACIHMKNPTILQELEPYVDGIVVDFGVEKEAIFDLLSGRAEPKGLLPMILPKNMDAVERHHEDIAFDIEPYKDSQGNVYTFGYGLDWNGQIYDDRLEEYSLEKSSIYTNK